jgi:hypothetical protein
MNKTENHVDSGGFFTEVGNGHRSSVRLMSLIALGASIWFSFMTIKLSSEMGLYISSLFLAAAFVPKVLQKLIENRFPVKGEDKK